MAPRLPLDDIQGIILDPYERQHMGHFLMLRVEDPARARKWLGSLDVTSVEAARKAEATADGDGDGDGDRDIFINVAFSYRGLAALGLTDALVEDFPFPFVEDSSLPRRSRILGDVDESSPERWAWGSGDKAVDVILLIYTAKADALEHERIRAEADIKQSGMSLVLPALHTSYLIGRKEHFGFRDLISQPSVRGSGDDDALPQNVVAPGEMLLGYEDGYGFTTYSPQTRDGFDFGKNGSYLVFRQLSQDVEAFWRFCMAQSGGHEAAERPVTVASKMVGRWPSGAPLVNYPDADPESAQLHRRGGGYIFEQHALGDYDLEDFTYQDEDPHGYRCPFGSHLRRSNPRDWELGESKAESLKMANLHRIMRRGRPYGPPYTPTMSPPSFIEKIQAGGDDVERGIHFLVFNADIERQFEFVQQQWCNNPKFAGLNSDADPVFGWHHPPEFRVDPPTFTIPQQSGRRRCTGITRFVQVRGSGYFFMPSLRAVAYLAEYEPPADEDEAAQ